MKSDMVVEDTVVEDLKRLNGEIRETAEKIAKELAYKNRIQINICLCSIESYLSGKSSFVEPGDRNRIIHLYETVGSIHPSLILFGEMGVDMVKRYKPSA